MFFGGSNGFNAFFPENIQDNPYVPPVVITSFKIFNKPVPIDAKSVLTKAISYVDGLTLSYRDNVFSFEFAALSYANSQRNRYRYKLEALEPGWNEVGSKQRLGDLHQSRPRQICFSVQGDQTAMACGMKKGCPCRFLITPLVEDKLAFARRAWRPCSDCSGRFINSGFANRRGTKGDFAKPLRPCRPWRLLLCPTATAPS
jgi:hypothetical protein